MLCLDKPIPRSEKISNSPLGEGRCIIATDISDGLYVTKDSGERREFATGSRRDVRTGKGRYDLLPSLCIKRLAGLYERGAVKYGDDNWRRGQQLSSTLDSMLRHSFKWAAIIRGEEVDDREDHLSAIVWNAFCLMWTIEQIESGRLPKELDDLSPKEK